MTGVGSNNDESLIYMTGVRSNNDESPIYMTGVRSNNDENPIYILTCHVPSHHHRLRGESMDAIDG